MLYLFCNFMSDNTLFFFVLFIIFAVCQCYLTDFLLTSFNCYLLLSSLTDIRSVSYFKGREQALLFTYSTCTIVHSIFHVGMLLIYLYCVLE